MACMDQSLFLFVFLLFSSIFCCVYASDRYSKYLNQNDDILKEERPFRMNKLNLIWQKAIKVTLIEI